MKNRIAMALIVSGLACLPACNEGPAQQASDTGHMEQKLNKYTEVRLTADLSGLSDSQRRLIPLLIDACAAMDQAFWIQAYGDKQAHVRCP